jgi:hypothetical protein
VQVNNCARKPRASRSIISDPATFLFRKSIAEQSNECNSKQPVSTGTTDNVNSQSIKVSSVVNKCMAVVIFQALGGVAFKRPEAVVVAMMVSYVVCQSEMAWRATACIVVKPAARGPQCKLVTVGVALPPKTLWTPARWFAETKTRSSKANLWSPFCKFAEIEATAEATRVRTLLTFCRSLSASLPVSTMARPRGKAKRA